MRKLAKAKKDLAKSSTASIIIIAVFGGLVFGTMQYKNSKEDDLDKVKKDIKKIKSNISTIKNERKQAMLSYETFNSIPENKLPTKSGFESSVERQRIAKKVLLDLNDKYRFTAMDPKLSPPGLKESTALIDIISSPLDINFDGMSDELVLSFVNDLKEKLPGYLKMTKLNIKRRGAIDSETLEKIKVTSSYLPLVSGAVSFEWYTLKSKNDKEGK